MKIVKVLMGAVAMAFAGAVLAAGAVNVNSADAKTLAKELDGVGDVTAERIVEERQHGAYKDMADLNKRVKGFGDRTAEKNKDRAKF